MGHCDPFHGLLLGGIGMGFDIWGLVASPNEKGLSTLA